MKMYFEKIPLVADPDPQRTSKKTQAALIQEGRAAYGLGLPADHCTSRFKDRDMCIDWGNGWRWEKEKHQERRRCSCDGCIRERNNG
jgi:hypothetical protein